MKKSMSFIAAIAMAATMVSAIPASAADITKESTEQSGSVILSHTEESTYKVVIPADKVADAEELEISASDVCVNFGQAVKVKVSSANSWKMVDTENKDNKIVYIAKLAGETLTGEAQVLEVAKGAGSAEIAIEAPEYEYAGDYEDTLIFTVSVGDATPTQQTEEPAGEEPAEE